jgi:hypothetical protein
MGDAATKIQTKPKSSAPDPTAPVEMYYWTLPNGQHFGNSNNRMAMVGGSFSDGEGTSGEVTAITMYAGIGTLIEVQPLRIERVGELPPKRYVAVLGIGHGAVLTDEKRDEMKARGGL